MARRRKNDTADSLREIFLLLPWWVGPPVAGAAYVALGHVLPAVLPSDPLGINFGAQLARGMSLPITAFVLFLWLIALAQKGDRRRRLDTQTGIHSIRAMNWREFELLIGEAFRRQGYIVRERGGSGGDGGVDLELTRAGERVLIQCKHWKKQKIGAPVLRDLLGAVTAEKASSGVLITTGTFTWEAKVWAEGQPLKLFDGGQLWEFVKGVRAGAAAVETAAAVGMAGAVAGAPGISPAPAAVMGAGTTKVAPACPKCGASMIRRTAGRGSNAGKDFWGCSRYPSCRGTRGI